QWGEAAASEPDAGKRRGQAPLARGPPLDRGSPSVISTERCTVHPSETGRSTQGRQRANLFWEAGFIKGIDDRLPGSRCMFATNCRLTERSVTPRIVSPTMPRVLNSGEMGRAH